MNARDALIEAIVNALIAGKIAAATLNAGQGNAESLHRETRDQGIRINQTMAIARLMGFDASGIYVAALDQFTAKK